MFISSGLQNYSADDETSGAAVGTGFLKLKMTAVPDAGSTVTLLGMALGGLGFFIRQRI